MLLRRAKTLPTAGAAFLDATERGDFGCNETFVDPDPAALQSPWD